MKISKRQLKRIIRKEINKPRINESIGVDTIEDLESVLAKAYREMIGTHPRTTGTSQWDARTMQAYDGDPHQDVTGSIMEIVQDILDNMESL